VSAALDFVCRFWGGKLSDCSFVRPSISERQGNIVKERVAMQGDRVKRGYRRPSNRLRWPTDEPGKPQPRSMSWPSVLKNIARKREEEAKRLNEAMGRVAERFEEKSA
jgi:hypothetical protein